jgi:hypothetical protein
MVEKKKNVCARLDRVQNKTTRGGVCCGRRVAGGHGARHPGSCTGAVETDAGWVVSDAVWVQGSGRHAWAARERVGHVRTCGPAGEEKAGSGPREQCRLRFKTNFKTEHDLIRSKVVFIMIKKFQINYGCEGIKIRNNFPYWNFSKFGIKFKLKIRKDF